MFNSVMTILSHIKKTSNALMSLGLVIWLCMLVIGARSYQGSLVVYISFSFVFLVLLVSLFHKRSGYVYTYLSILLWLGFWLKVTYHLILNYPYVEPTGGFIGTGSNWDNVLLVSMVAVAGVVLSHLSFCFLIRNIKSLGYERKKIPTWLIGLNRFHWVIFALALVLVVYLNVRYGIYVIGFNVATILAWPLNALITLMIGGGGFSAWIALILWWNVKSGNKIFRSVVYMMLTGLVITASTLSRGQVVFVSVPILYALFLNRAKIIDYSFKNSVFIVAVFFMLVVSSFFVVNQLRDRFYYSREDSVALDGADKVRSFLHFSVDRWVGVEGVMAVSAFPEVGKSLFLDALIEKPNKDRLSIYQTICPWPSSQSTVLKNNVRLFSLPGGVAFLYYSGSLMVVFLMVFMIVFILQGIELLVYYITGNPLLCSGLGWLMAITFAHFGGAPRYVIPVIEFQIILIALVGVVQSDWFASYANRVVKN
jgi:hypothetical protein